MGFWQTLEARGWYFLTTLLGGWPETVSVATGALAFALVFGLVIALLRLSRWRILRILAISHIEFFRGADPSATVRHLFGFPGGPASPFQAAIIGSASTVPPISRRFTAPGSSPSTAARWRPPCRSA
jgi:ABC-type amino acid transport system permease subunit